MSRAGSSCAAFSPGKHLKGFREPMLATLPQPRALHPWQSVGASRLPATRFKGTLSVLLAGFTSATFVIHAGISCFPDARFRPNCRSQRFAQASSALYDEVKDFAGNGTAYALRRTAVPLHEPDVPAQQYMVSTFSPGFVVDGVISPAACARIVHLSEGIGFRKRWGQVGAVTLFMEEEFSQRIFDRLKPYLPDHFGGRPVGINRRWAVLKYEPGEYLSPHVDGHVPGTNREGHELVYDKSTRSYMTCLFWLSDKVEGGETVFTYPQGGIWVAVPPKTGAALLFYHGQNAISNPVHYGGDVKSGTKYLVRSDIIYKN